MNVEDALDKARQMLTSAAFVPKETSDETVKKVEEYKKRSNEKRIETKKLKSSKKMDRKFID